MSPPSSADAKDGFEPKPVLPYVYKVGGQAALVGLFVSTLQNALGKHNYGAMGVVTRTGGTIGFFAAMGAVFAGTETVVANVREKKDALNGASGACVAGFLAGVRQKSLPMAFGGCAVLGGAMAIFDYSGELAGASAQSKEERRRRFFKTPPEELFKSEPSA